MEAIVNRYFELVNNDAVEELLELWDDNGTFGMPLRGTLKGKEEIRAFYESLPALYAKHHDGPVKAVISDNQAVVKVKVTNMTAEGKTISFDAFSWMTFDENQKLLSIEAQFDTAKLLKDLKG